MQKISRCIQQFQPSGPQDARLGSLTLLQRCSRCILQPQLTGQAEYCGRIKDEYISDVLIWTPTQGQISVEPPAKSYIHKNVRTLDTVWRTCQERWMIGTDGEREKERVKEFRAVGTTMMMIMMMAARRQDTK